MKILITGVSGYLGYELAKKLSSHQIIGIDIKKFRSEFPKHVKFINKSILEPDLESVFAQIAPDICIHLAWTVTPVHKKYLQKALELDYTGTQKIFYYCKSTQVKHIIFMSSTLAYGALKDNPEILTEESPLRAKKSFHYAYNKRIVENEIVQGFIRENPSIKVTVIRAPGFLGPTVKNYVSGILKSKFLPVMIGGRQTPIQFLHIKDLLDVFELVIDKEIAGTYNVAPSDTLLMKEIPNHLKGIKIYLPEFLARLGVSILWFFHFYKTPSSYLDFVRYPFLVSNDKIRKDLGWKPQYSTKDAIESLIE